MMEMQVDNSLLFFSQHVVMRIIALYTILLLTWSTAVMSLFSLQQVFNLFQYDFGNDFPELSLILLVFAVLGFFIKVKNVFF